MKLHLLPIHACATALLLLLTNPAPAADLAPNAALIYWSAFDQYEASAKDAAFTQAVENFPTVTIDAKVRGYVNGSATLELLRLASAVGPCDWGVHMLLKEQGPYVLMPHLSKCRALARLGLLSARVRLNDKQGDKAVDRIIEVYTLARHSQASGVAISLLVGIAIDHMTHQFVADNLAAFSTAELTALRDRMTTLAPMLHIKAMVAIERDGFGGWIKKQAEKLKDRAERDKMFALFTAEQKLELAKIGATDNDKFIELVDDMMKIYEPLEKMLELPPGEFEKAHEQWLKGVNDSKNGLSKMLVPAFASVHASYHRNLAISAATRALLTLRIDGKEKFDALRDPYGDGPFTLKTTDAGVEISSKLTGKDQQPATIKSMWKPGS